MSGTSISIPQHLGNKNLTQTDATRTYDANSGVLIFDSLSQLKMIATVAPPLGSGNVVAKGRFMFDVSDTLFGTVDDTQPEGTIYIGNATSSGSVPVIQSKGTANKTGLQLISQTNDANPNPDFAITTRVNSTTTHTDLTRLTFSLKNGAVPLIHVLRNGNIALGGLNTPTAQLDIKSKSTSASILKIQNLAGSSNVTNITEGQTRLEHILAPPLGEANFSYTGSGSLFTDIILNYKNNLGQSVFKGSGNGNVWSNGPFASSSNTMFGENASRLSLFNSINRSVFGNSSAFRQLGDNLSAFGIISATQSIGLDVNAFGRQSAYFNNWDYYCRFGSSTGNETEFIEDVAGRKTFADTDITPNTITIPAHNFAAIGKYVNLKFRRNSGANPTGLSNGVYYQFLVVDANTLSLSGIASTGTGSYSLTRDFERTNSVGLGFDSVPTVLNQVRLGNDNTTHGMMKAKTSAEINAIPRPTINMWAKHSPSGKIATFNGTNWEIPTTMTAI